MKKTGTIAQIKIKIKMIKKFNDSGHGASKKRKSKGEGPHRPKKLRKFCKV